MLRELRNYKWKLFLCPTVKIGENTTNIFKLLFFTINLHFATSNQMSTYRKLNLCSSSSIYFIFLSLEMQKTLEQTKVYHALSYFVWKEMTHKPVCFLLVQLASMNVFLCYVITGRHNFSWKIIVTQWFF